MTPSSKTMPSSLQHQAVAAAARLRACSRRWCRCGSGTRRRPGPTTSILPSVEASRMPTVVRTARHSRATAACMSSPALREVPGALPLADVLEDRAVRRVPVVHRRARGRDRTARRRCAAGERAEGRPACRAGGRSWCRPAAIALPSASARMREGVDVGGLALVGAHAGRGVALDVLDRAEALARRRARCRRR